MRTIRTKVYQFDELTEEAKVKAVSDHIDFIIEFGMADEDSPYYPAVKEMEELQTPWFLGQVIFDRYRVQVEEDIRANEYDFMKDGRLFNLSTLLNK